MKLDTLEKHVGKVYDNKTVNGNDKYIIRWNYVEECQQVQYEDEYKKFLVSKGKLKESGGTIIPIFGKMMEIIFLSKTIQLCTIFKILSSGRSMKYYQNYMNISLFFNCRIFQLLIGM